MLPKNLCRRGTSRFFERETLTGLVQVRGVGKNETPMSIAAWQLRPEKVPWMSNYEAGKLQWSIDEKTGVAVPLPKAGSMDSKKKYGAQRIHVEFRTLQMTEAERRSEASGNSGIYIQEHLHPVEFRNVWVSDIGSPKRLDSYDPRRKK